MEPGPEETNRMRRIGLTWASVAVLALGLSAWGEEWPQYRGPRRDGISQEKGLLPRWPAEGSTSYGGVGKTSR